MVGFTCYVQGKVDPSEFFYGLRLCFDEPPHLSQLRRAVEEAVVGDNALPDGADYAVSDFEILDLRLNEWVMLETRAQLYSGCHLAAVRDAISSTCAGAVETVAQPLEKRVLGFALDARRVFEALDVESEGELRLKGLLTALRHDPNYAVDLFALMDQRNVGVVTLQDYMQWFNAAPSGQFRELHDRLRHGGMTTEQQWAPNGGAASNATTTGNEDGIPVLDGAPLSRNTSAYTLVPLSEVRSKYTVPRTAQPPTSGTPPAPGRETPTQEAARGSRASKREGDSTKAPTNAVPSPADSPAPPPLASVVSGVAAVPPAASGTGTNPNQPQFKDPGNLDAARRVIDLLQKSVEQSKRRTQGDLPESIVSRLKSMRKVAHMTAAAEGQRSNPAAPASATTAAAAASFASQSTTPENANLASSVGAERKREKKTHS